MMIFSLVSTTSVGYNLFLGGSMAQVRRNSLFHLIIKYFLFLPQGRELRSAQRGIAFSTISAVSVSILILIVGSGFHQEGAVKVSNCHAIVSIKFANSMWFYLGIFYQSTWRLYI